MQNKDKDHHHHCGQQSLAPKVISLYMSKAKSLPGNLKELSTKHQRKLSNKSQKKRQLCSVPVDRKSTMETKPRGQK